MRRHLVGRRLRQTNVGSPRVLMVIDLRTLSFADLPGNRQFISVGNLTQDDRVAVFLVD